MGKKQKYTPGPWYVRLGPKYGDFQIHAPYGEGGIYSHCLANIKCDSCPAHEKGNADLMAAAPDLLEALKDMVKICPDEITQAALDAINKAEGN